MTAMKFPSKMHRTIETSTIIVATGEEHFDYLVLYTHHGILTIAPSSHKQKQSKQEFLLLLEVSLQVSEMPPTRKKKKKKNI